MIDWYVKKADKPAMIRTTARYVLRLLDLSLIKTLEAKIFSYKKISLKSIINYEKTKCREKRIFTIDRKN